MTVAVLAATTAAAVGLQIVYPLTHSTLRDQLTVAIVATFALACVLHAALSRGVRTAVVMLVVSAVGGYLVELLGVHTGVPFGSYEYLHVLGPRLLAVPLVVPLAWTMLAWPAALVARRLCSGTLPRIVVGAWAMTAGDVFLDPQMVAAGAWRWRDPHWHLPGTPGVPLSNYAGWLLVALVLSALLQASMGDGDDALGVGLYLWSWLGWTVALSVFLGQPLAALWGAVAMGTVAVPVAVTCWHARRTPLRPAAGAATW